MSNNGYLKMELLDTSLTTYIYMYNLRKQSVLLSCNQKKN